MSGNADFGERASDIPTLHELAKKLGISTATVSRALAGHPYVNEDLRARVVRTARELGYRPNGLARALRAQTTHTIGLVIPDIQNDFFAQSATVLQHVLEERGYQLILCISGNDQARDHRYVRTLVENRVDGIVHVPSGPATPLNDLQVGGRHIGLVELLRHTTDSPFDAVISDDREGAAALTSYLLGLGHRRIAMITGPREYSTTRYRVEGFNEALHGFPGAEGQVRYGTWSPAFGYEATRELLAQPLRPTAIFSSGNPLASGILRALREVECVIPRDISLVSYEDPEWYAGSNPPLTGYALPLAQMGRMAADLLLQRLSTPRAAPARPTIVKLSGRLIVRQSARSIESTNRRDCGASAGEAVR